jgi:hypothetical protein
VQADTSLFQQTQGQLIEKFEEIREKHDTDALLDFDQIHHYTDKCVSIPIYELISFE